MCADDENELYPDEHLKSGEAICMEVFSYASENFKTVISDQYGTHVLRALICVLGGIRLR